jgi:hypothetical protein
MIVDIEPVLAPFAQAAVARLSYLYPECSFSIDGVHLVVRSGSGANETTLRRDVTYQLYREKIYQEGLVMRSAMYETLFR